MYVCHDSGFNKISKTDIKKRKSKNTQCYAKIDIRIKLTTKDTKKKKMSL